MFWDDVLRLRSRARNDLAVEQPSVDENTTPENTDTDNTIEQANEVVANTNNNHNKNTGEEAPAEENVRGFLDQFPSLGLFDLRLPPRPRGLSIKRLQDQNEFCFWLLTCFFSVISWALINARHLHHISVVLLIIADALGWEGAAPRLKLLTFGFWPPAMIFWPFSPEGKAAKQEYLAAKDKLMAECYEEFKHIYDQDQAKRKAWMESF